jgi:hypothetical protein
MIASNLDFAQDTGYFTHCFSENALPFLFVLIIYIESDKSNFPPLKFFPLIFLFFFEKKKNTGIYSASS